MEQDDGEGGVTVTVRGQTLNGLAGQRTTLPLEGEANGGYDVVPALESAGQTPDPVPAETILDVRGPAPGQPVGPQAEDPLLVLAPDQGRGMETV